MKVEGTFTFAQATPDAVWQALTDPARITACLPGCKGLEAVAEHSYRMEMKVGIGPIRSVFSGSVELADLEPPSRYTMRVKGTGPAGFADGEGSILIESQGTDARVGYSGEVAVGGKIAALGQRMVGGAARMVIDQFFKCIANNLGRTAH